MSEIICYCMAVSKVTIETAIQNGAKSLRDIQEATGACTGNNCKTMNPKGVCCSADIVKLLPKKMAGCNCNCKTE